jgi:homopolymeric O-antigen transport system permease protein
VTAIGGAAASRVRLRHVLDVIGQLVVREVNLRYRRSALGWLWSLAQPVARFLVLTFVFTTVLPLDVPNYAVFLFSGLIGWMWFSSALSSATSSALDRRDLLMRPGIPRMVIPVVSVLSDATDYLAALPVLAVILLFSGGIPLTWLLLPVVLLPMFLLVLGLGYGLCAANVYLRDVSILVGVATLLGFYVTPVFYSPDQVPADFRWVVELNPVSVLLELQRDVLVEGVVPSAGQLLSAYAVGLVALLVGGAVYRRLSPTFVDEL